MNKCFVFFHVGDDVVLPKMLVDSIRWSNPDAKIIFCTDVNTPEISHVDERIEVLGDRGHLMTYRLEAFSKCGIDGPAIYLDTDMLVIKPIEPATLLAGAQIAMCRRSFNLEMPFNGSFRNLDFREYDKKPLGFVYPIVACCTVTSSSGVWGGVLERLLRLSPKFHSWYGDQEALKRLSEDDSNGRRGGVAYLPESIYGCLPEALSFLPNAAIVHFKGARKVGMGSAYAEMRAKFARC